MSGAAGEAEARRGGGEEGKGEGRGGGREDQVLDAHHLQEVLVAVHQLLEGGIEVSRGHVLSGGGLEAAEERGEASSGVEGATRHRGGDANGERRRHRRNRVNPNQA